MHSITVGAYLPFYKFGALGRLWFAHTPLIAYVYAQFLLLTTVLCLECRENTTHMDYQIYTFGTWNLDQTGPNFLIINLYASVKHMTNCTRTQPGSDH
jgi:hypothetical protein